MSKEIIEIQHIKRNAKTELSKLGEVGQVPRWRPELIGRWRAVPSNRTGGYKVLSGEDKKMLNAAIEIISSLDQGRVKDQRDIYYSIRGMFGDQWTYKGLPLKSKKVYGAFTGPLMEALQIASGKTLQSFDVRPGPRGMVAGIGFLRTRIGTVPLSARPVLTFDLADDGVTYHGDARKVIQYEKAAGFEDLISNSLPEMIEAMFATSQGYIVEACNKFLHDMEGRGKTIYTLYDGDPHGLQMQLMFGMSSKSSAYMPTNFYPQNSTPIGLFPSVAKTLGLPPEEVDDSHKRIIPNILKLAGEKRGLIPEVEAFANRPIDEIRKLFEKVNLAKSQKNEKLVAKLLGEGIWQQWEIQALSGMGQSTSQLWIVESLRVVGDEIKYVPAADEIKEDLEPEIKDKLDRLISDTIDSYVNRILSPVKEDIKERLRELLEDAIIEIEEKSADELRKFQDTESWILREAVKAKLVQRPTRIYHDAERRVINDSMKTSATITSDIDVTFTLDDASIDAKVQVTPPEEPDRLLNKDDICGAIERKLEKSTKKRIDLVGRLRSALEKKFGKPNLEW